MADNVKRKAPFRVPQFNIDVADPDRRRKGQPNLLPIHGRKRGKEPIKAQLSTERKTLGILVPGGKQNLAMKIVNQVGDVAIHYNRAERLVDGNPVLQFFISGPTYKVVEAMSQLTGSNLILHSYDIAKGAGEVRPPNIYYDTSVKKRAR